MILVTVGTQLPFDRLIHAVEEWALSHAVEDLIFQVGKGGYMPKIGKCSEYIPVSLLDEYTKSVNLIIGHAGMGTIISALTQGKPLVLLPRLHKYSEHRNDHQLATYNRFKGVAGIYPAACENAVPVQINAALSRKNSQKSIQHKEEKDLAQIVNFIKSAL